MLSEQNKKLKSQIPVKKKGATRSKSQLVHTSEYDDVSSMLSDVRQLINQFKGRNEVTVRTDEQPQ